MVGEVDGLGRVRENVQAVDGLAARPHRLRRLLHALLLAVLAILQLKHLYI